MKIREGVRTDHRALRFMRRPFPQPRGGSRDNAGTLAETSIEACMSIDQQVPRHRPENHRTGAPPSVFRSPGPARPSSTRGLGAGPQSHGSSSGCLTVLRPHEGVSFITPSFAGKIPRKVSGPRKAPVSLSLSKAGQGSGASLRGSLLEDYAVLATSPPRKAGWLPKTAPVHGEPRATSRFDRDRFFFYSLALMGTKCL